MRLPFPLIPMVSVAAGAALLAGCAVGGTSATPTSQRPTATVTVTQPSGEGSADRPLTVPETQLPSLPPSKVITVNKKVTDPATGTSVEVVNYLRHYPKPAGKENDYLNTDIVLVQARIAEGGKYYGTGLKARSFVLVNSIGNTGARDPVVTQELKKAGFAELNPYRASVGWLAFRITPQNSAGLSLRISRPRSTDTTHKRPVPQWSATVRLPE